MHSVLKMLSITVIMEFTSCLLMTLYYWRCVVYVCSVCVCDCVYVYVSVYICVCGVGVMV